MKVSLKDPADQHKINDMFFATLKSLGVDLRIDPSFGLVGCAQEDFETVNNIAGQINDQIEGGKFAEVGSSKEDAERLVSMAKMRALVKKLRASLGDDLAYQLVVKVAKEAAKDLGKPNLGCIPDSLEEFKEWCSKRDVESPVEPYVSDLSGFFPSSEAPSETTYGRN